MFGRSRGGQVPQYHRSTSGLDSALGALGRQSQSLAQIGARQGPLGMAAAALSGMAEGMIGDAEREQAAEYTAYLARMELSVDESLGKMADDHPDDPVAFRTRADTAKAEWLQQLPEEDREMAAVAYDRKVMRVLDPIQRQQKLKQKTERKSVFLETQLRAEDAAAAAMRRGDRAAAEEERTRFEVARNVMFAEGLISAEEHVISGERFAGNLKRHEWLGRFDQSKAKGLGAAEQFIRQFQDPATEPDMNPDDRDKIAYAMNRDLADLRAEHRQAVSDNREQARVALEAITSGRTFVGLDGVRQRARALGDTDTLRSLDQAQALAKGAEEFGQLPLQKQATIIADKRKAVGSAFDNARLDAFEKIHHQTAIELARDPLGFAEARGLRQITPIDLNSPGNLSGSLAKRVEDGKWLRNRYGLTETPILRADEVKLMKAQLGEATADEKTALLSQLTAGLGKGHLPGVLKQLSESEPEFAHAGKIGLTDPDAARTIIIGEEVRRTQPQYLPKPDALRNGMNGELPPALLKSFSPTFQQGIEKTVQAVYAKLSMDAGDSSKLVDTARLQDAVAMVTGGLVEYDRPGLTTGRFRTIAPVRGMTRDQFGALLDGLADADLGEQPYIASTDKKSGGTVTAENIRSYGDLTPLGDGTYAVTIADQPVVKKDGKPFVLDLAGMIRRKAQAATIAPPLAK